MRRRSSFDSIKAAIAAAALLAAVWGLPAGAGTPDWLRAAARTTLPRLPAETNAVALLDEQFTSVNADGEAKIMVRRAWKILRFEGRGVATAGVYFDSETRVTFFKGWTISAQGAEYELKEGDAVETSPFEGVYADTRYKLMKLPAAEPGSVVGYEYEQKKRPSLHQDLWRFQQDIPLLRAQFTLELPAGWEFDAQWLNCPATPPRSAGERRWQWQVDNVAPLENEPAMPARRSVAGALGLRYHPATGGDPGLVSGSWPAVGRWFAQLAAPRAASSAAIRQKTAELLAASPDPLARLLTIAAFVQRDVRYVAIEIGIGGYQPQGAADTISNRYGDCKAKAALMIAMLREAGLPAHFVLLHSARGVVAPQFPSPLSFNHAIVAVQIPENVTGPPLYAAQTHGRLGHLLFFDPTDPFTPAGYLPVHEQGALALLVREEGGELVTLPVVAPAANRLMRTAKLAISADGALSGEVHEVRWGDRGVRLRDAMRQKELSDRAKLVEQFLAGSMPTFRLTRAGTTKVDGEYDDHFSVVYSFVAERYAQRAGKLLLFNPRVIGSKATDVRQEKPRKYGIELAATTLDTDTVEIEIPPEYSVDELPQAVELQHSFGRYRSSTELKGTTLRYNRFFEITKLSVPAEQYTEVRAFFERIEEDERASVVLKQVSAQKARSVP